MKRQICKIVKADETEEKVKTGELKCPSYEEQKCCRFIRKIEENRMKVHSPRSHRNKTLKKWDFLHFQRCKDDWMLKRIRTAEETFVPCLKCKPVRVQMV
jgi:hypothetical protein